MFWLLKDGDCTSCFFLVQAIEYHLFAIAGHPIYRQEPKRTDKSRQEAFLCIFLLKYYLLDHIYALYIQISHRIAFAAPQNNEFTTLQIALLTDKKFCEVALAVYVGCHSDVSVIPKTA